MEVEDLRDELIPRLQRIEAKQDAINGRVRDVELWRAKAAGVMYALLFLTTLPAMIAAVAGVILALRS
jgi:tetrahydromethanopterin S-methyltransferase subunit E